MRIQYTRKGYIYAGVGIRKINIYLMMTCKERRRIKIKYVQYVSTSRIDKGSNA